MIFSTWFLNTFQYLTSQDEPSTLYFGKFRLKMLPRRELDADKFLSEIVVVLAVGHSAAGMVGKYLVTIKIFACHLLLLSTVSMLTEN